MEKNGNKKDGLSHIFDLQEKIVVVTGGMGILGTQYVKTFIEAGAKVASFDIQTKKQNNFYRKNKGNKNLILCEVDITNKKQIEKSVQKVVEVFGIPSVLINNAAIDSPPGSSAKANGPFENFPEEILDQSYSVNIKGMIFCCQIIGPIMADNGGGSIINISSLYGNVSPNQRLYEYRRKEGDNFYKPVSYSVTKSGVLNLTRYLATYWADKNVRVNTLSPGGVYNRQDERFLDAYCQLVPMGRMAKKDEYNGAIVFLASNASSYMTGANLIIDGGMTAW